MNAPEVDALLTAVQTFSVPLRMGDGINEVGLAELRKALRSCAEAWQYVDTVPKLAMNVLVDVYPTVEASSYLYEAEYASRIRDLAVEIADLVHLCVATSPPEGSGI